MVVMDLRGIIILHSHAKGKGNCEKFFNLFACLFGYVSIWQPARAIPPQQAGQQPFYTLTAVL